MNGFDSRRRALALGLPAAALLAAGCTGLGGDTPSPTWYLLQDGRPAAAAPEAAGPRIERVLLVGPVDASAFDESVMLAYGRSQGTRAHYQFAGWTDRPARRLGVLVERRLAARGRFGGVAQSTSGARGDLVLSLALEHLYHDVSSTPGSARVAVRADLLDWGKRSLIARRAFEQSQGVEREAADAAVDAINRAVAAVLDELCPWVEAAARASPA